MASWYVQRNGKEHGPFNDAHLRKLAASGELTPSDLVRRDDLTVGRPAREIIGLFDQPQAAAAATAVKRPPAPPRFRSQAAPLSPPSQLAPEWHYAQNNVQSGPVTFSQLKDLASSGRLHATDLVWKMGTPDWREAHTVQGLFSPPANGAVQPPQTPPPIGSGVAPALWNPTVIRVLGFFFTWGFGAFLVAKNWRALGETAKAKRSMIWFYSIFAWLLFAFVTPDTEMITRSSWFAGMMIFVCWANFEAQPQIKYVKERFGKDYPRKGWLIPVGSAIGVAFVGLVCLMLVSVLVVLDEHGMLDESNSAGNESQSVLANQYVPEDQYVTTVKQGSLHARPGILVGAVVNSFLSEPKWSSGVTAAGQHFVNAEGGMLYHNKPVHALVQFYVSEVGFEFHTMEFNGVPQNKLTGMAVLAKMYEEFEK